MKKKGETVQLGAMRTGLPLTRKTTKGETTFNVQQLAAQVRAIRNGYVVEVGFACPSCQCRAFLDVAVPVAMLPTTTTRGKWHHIVRDQEGEMTDLLTREIDLPLPPTIG